MPSQPCPETFSEGRVKTDSLAEKLGSFSEEVKTNVAFPQTDPWITIFSFVSLPRQSERFLCHFGLGPIGTLSNSCDALAIYVPRFNVECGIGASGVATQNSVEWDQLFQHVRP